MIPPAWTDVEINASSRAKICATGYDAKVRKQYIYNSKFREKQEHLKFERIISFGEQLSTMRKIVEKHIRKRKLNREKVLATMLHLMEIAYFRPGNELYTKQKKSYTFPCVALNSRFLLLFTKPLLYPSNEILNQQCCNKTRNTTYNRKNHGFEDIFGLDIHGNAEKSSKASTNLCGVVCIVHITQFYRINHIN